MLLELKIGLVLAAIVLSVLVVHGIGRRDLAGWMVERQRVREALFAEMGPKRDQGAIRALVHARKRLKGPQVRCWMAFFDDRIVSISPTGERKASAYRDLDGVDLLESSGDDFGIEIKSRSGRSSVDGAWTLDAAVDLASVVAALTGKGVAIRHRVIP